jgi:hypothetical protein
MKKQLQHLKLFLPALFIAIAISSHAQQEFTLTTSAANVISSKALIDLPGLSGNPLAIIIATPLGNTKTLNPHPTGAWYYSGKWNIFNCDQAALITGLTFKVQYFLNPGPSQFLHLVTLQNLGSDGSYIDNPALNNKPNVQFTIFQNHSPDVRPGSWLNQAEAIAAYNAAAGKWYITNTGGQPLQKGCAYNIVVSSTGTTPLPPIPIPISETQLCKCPASLPPNGQATGDLAGMYPNPMVTKLLNRPLSNTPPLIGQILKWNGTEWSPSEDIANSNNNTGSANVYTPGLGIDITNNEISAAASTPMWNASQILGRDIMTTPPTVGQVLKWGGGSWSPADDNVAAATASITPQIQSFYKNANTTASWIYKQNFSDLTELYHTITLTKRSRLVISAMVTIAPALCDFDCKPIIAFFTVGIDSAPNSGTPYFEVKVYAPPMNWATASISSYMVDLNPGTHIVSFSFFNFSEFGIRATDQRQSSVMVIPLE